MKKYSVGRNFTLLVDASSNEVAFWVKKKNNKERKKERKKMKKIVKEVEATLKSTEVILRTSDPMHT